MNLRQPPISLYLLLICLILLAVIAASQQNWERETKPTPWTAPVIATLAPTPTAAGGWWSELPAPIPLSSPTPKP
jgi:hypothetical protein